MWSNANELQDDSLQESNEGETDSELMEELQESNEEEETNIDESQDNSLQNQMKKRQLLNHLEKDHGMSLMWAKQKTIRLVKKAYAWLC